MFDEGECPWSHALQLSDSEHEGLLADCISLVSQLFCSADHFACHIQETISTVKWKESGCNQMKCVGKLMLYHAIL